MVGINICAKLSMNYTTFDQIYLYTNSIRGHRCPISHIDALSMPFSMGDEKGIHIDARLQSSMPSGTPGVRELKFWENVHHPQHVTGHVSCVSCHISRVTSHMSCFFLQIGEAYWWRVCYQPGLPRLVLTQCYNLHTSRELVSPVCGIFLWGISNSHSLFFKKSSPPPEPPNPTPSELVHLLFIFFTFPNS